MIFISAGHNPKGLKPDPGAVGNGYTEANLASEFRDLVCAQLRIAGVEFVTDTDDEKLGTYLERIKTGPASVVVEFHFDAAISNQATGATSLIEAEADRLDRAFAQELVNEGSTILGIKNRGVKSETESHRGYLGLMREHGIICLYEICFISNAADIQTYQANKNKLATRFASILIKYENML